MSHKRQTPKTAPIHPPLLTLEQVALGLGLSTRTIERAVKRGLFPEPLRIGASLRWQCDAPLIYLRNKKRARDLAGELSQERLEAYYANRLEAQRLARERRKLLLLFLVRPDLTGRNR